MPKVIPTKDWKKEYSGWLCSAPTGSSDDFWCKTCKCSIKHKKDSVLKHSQSRKHSLTASSISCSQQLTKFVDVIPDKIKVFDIRWSIGVACHSAIRATDHLSEIIRDCSGESDILKGIKVHRTKCSSIIQNVVYPSLHNEILKDLLSNKFSLIIDEATDVSVMKHLCLCVKYFKEEEKSFRNSFLTLIPVTSTTSESLFNDIKNFFDANNIPLSNCIGLGTDGASNLCGKNNSVFTRLKQYSPKCLLVRCICHSLSLCCKNAFSELPSNLGYLLSLISRWFKFSSEKRDQFNQLFKVMNANIPDLKPLKFVSPCETRWLVTGKVIYSIIVQWHELIAYFNSINYKKNYDLNHQLVPMLNDRANYLYLSFACPIVSDFEKLNASFQATEIDQYMLFMDLELLYKSLRRRICKVECIDKCNEISDSELKSLNDIDFGAKFGLELEKSSNLNECQKMDIKKRCLKFLIVATDQVYKRLPEKFEYLTILKACHPQTMLSQVHCVNFSELPFCNKSDINESVGEVEKLETQYRSVCLINWKTFEINLNNITAFWGNVYFFKNAAGEYCFRELATKVLEILCLPISNAFVERIFSQVTIVKSKLRNKMGLKMLNSILTIRSRFMLNGMCCNKFVVTKEMLSTFHSKQMYNKNSDSNTQRIEEENEAEDNLNTILEDLSSDD